MNYMNYMDYLYLGYCVNESCERGGQEVSFPVQHDKVDAFRNEPPTCSGCGDFLQGDIYDVE